MSSWPNINEEDYAYRVSDFAGHGHVVCRRCGAWVALPMPEAASPDSIELHDAFHEHIDKLWQAHRRREEWEAEQAEREG